MRRLYLTILVIGLALRGGPSPLAAESAHADAVAVIVGNSVYLHPDVPTVDYAHRDAEAMHRFVRDVLGFREENILLLMDASQAQMESTFGRQGNPRGKVFQYIHPGKSDLFVFYSGHGLPGREQGRSYLLPADADLATVEINGYPLDVLYDNLGQLGARSVSVYVDACFSGSSHRGPLIKGASGVTIVPKAEASPESLTIITAASADQLASWDDDSQHGLFTEYLLRALYGEADSPGHGNNDGQVTLAEVKAFLDDEMRYKARRSYNREQVPTVLGPPDRVLVRAPEGGFPTRPTLSVPPRVQSSPPTLDPLDKEMEAIATSNVRAAPDLDTARVGVLPKGARVRVTGKVADRPWYLVERDGARLGYVYASLLREQAPDPEPTETPDSTKEALEDRLQRLENELEQRARDHAPDNAPPPPRLEEEFDPRRPPPPGSRLARRPPPRPPFDRPGGAPPPHPPARLIMDLLNEMAQILVRQNYIEKVDVPVACPGPDSGTCRAEGSSALFYSQIKPLPRACALNVTVTFEHDRLIRPDGSRKGTYIQDRVVTLEFQEPQKVLDRTLTIKSQTDGQLLEVTHYLFGRARFIHRNDRDRFVEKALELGRLCRDGPVLARPPRS
ncbi:hypothetical protein JCM17960_16160 [Magnetospira thiophila]